MILSVSRRTDIPCHYAEWFMERVRDGFVFCRNPRRPSQISRIPITPDCVDAIVFWTKDPGPLVPYLDELDSRGFRYYFQVTLTPYGKDLEPGLREKREILADVCRLGKRVGKRGLVWRYDPVLFTPHYTLSWHEHAFAALCRVMAPFTDQVTISFLDEYRGMRHSGLHAPSNEEMERFASFAGETAALAGLSVRACSEKGDYSRYGILPASCIDEKRLCDLVGAPLKLSHDNGQRENCGCYKSVDIGAYDTCPNGCIYCYANSHFSLLARNLSRYRLKSPLLCSGLLPDDRIIEKSYTSDRIQQISFF